FAEEAIGPGTLRSSVAPASSCIADSLQRATSTGVGQGGPGGACFWVTGAPAWTGGVSVSNSSLESAEVPLDARGAARFAGGCATGRAACAGERGAGAAGAEPAAGAAAGATTGAAAA